MPTGVLKKFFDDKGFGFIAPDDQSPDLFAHKRNFAGNESDIRDGARITYESTMDDKSGKPRASTWNVEGSAPSPAAPMFQLPKIGVGTGSLKRFFQDKGFGFIACDDGSGDVFAPARTFKGDELTIRDGMRVTYECGPDDKTGKTRATTWSAALDDMSSLAGLGGLLGGLGGAAGGFGAMLQPTAASAFSPYGFNPLAQAGFAAASLGQAALPPGWEQVSDPTTGNTYYCNRATGESSWTIPAATPAMADPMAAMAAAMAAQTAPSATAATPTMADPMAAMAAAMAQTAPAAAAAAPATADPMAAMAAASTAPAALETPAAVAPAPAAALPAGWESTSDPASGKTYYFNRGTGQTSWEPPQA